MTIPALKQNTILARLDLWEAFLLEHDWPPGVTLDLGFITLESLPGYRASVRVLGGEPEIWQKVVLTPHQAAMDESRDAMMTHN